MGYFLQKTRQFFTLRLFLFTVVSLYKMLTVSAILIRVIQFLLTSTFVLMHHTFVLMHHFPEGVHAHRSPLRTPLRETHL